MAAGKGKIWAIRMPGGPTRIVRSKKDLSEQDAKNIYSNSFAYLTAECLGDLECVWPLCKVIDEIEMNRDYSQFLQVSERTGMPRGLVEV